MKVMVGASIDHAFVTCLKDECRKHNVIFSEYLTAALESFMSPSEYVTKKNEEINDRLRRKSTPSVSHEADSAIGQG